MNANVADCPEDLLVAARRRPLRREEAATLAEHLGRCPLCRMSAGLGRSLGRLPPIEDEDRALAAHVLEAVYSSRSAAGQATPVARIPARTSPGVRTAPGVRTSLVTRGRRRPRRRLFTAAAAVILMAGSASAAWWHHVRSSSAPLASPAPAQPTPTRAPTAPTADSPVVEADSPAPRAPLPSPTPTSAAQLFAAARRARATGDLGRAIALYRRLQSAFPRSAETRLSWLSLAQVYLKADQPAQAVAQYDAYFESGDEALAEEATMGKAGALARLGRLKEEETLWQRFLRDYPDSDYRWRAQQRLQELEGALP
jgi:TolA-binding protein